MRSTFIFFVLCYMLIVLHWVKVTMIYFPQELILKGPLQDFQRPGAWFKFFVSKNFGLQPYRPLAVIAVAEGEKCSATAVDLRLTPGLGHSAFSIVFYWIEALRSNTLQAMGCCTRGRSQIM